jgi:hypothetical protein
MMTPNTRFTIGPLFVAATVLALTSYASLLAQRGSPAPPAAAARASAPIDITGYWHSIIVDDFRFRVTPQKGDIEYIPLTPAARTVALEWDPDRDLAQGHECKAYGAVGVMQQPGRLHITWEDDQTLRIDTDSGSQTRRLHFGRRPTAPPSPSLQGYSAARWVLGGRGRGGQAGPPTGELEVVTTQMLPGYLRKNGIPYSENAVYTEYFYVLRNRTGQPFLTVTTSVVDPVNLTQPFIYAYHFGRQPDSTGWAPTPCWNK